MLPEEAKQAAPETKEKPKSEAPKPSKELQANCLGCGKPIKKLKRYYRDGKLYCNKKCWRKFIKSPEKK
jgi:predicted transcriptional regulator